MAAIEKVLNKGLKFAILPIKLDLTQVLVDFKRFERTMIGQQLWFGRSKSQEYTSPIFKEKIYNL